ncbi:hypothetical protein [Jiangella gansuensis]|uniref:hypothetical protein n=1 Tax=Jiangella gansuensis TaxID=281473 RepID=UPI0004BB23B7|nr:hypothetical protein [Jiangella gansuensis]
MSETTWTEGPGPLRDVREGMTVVDSAGSELGTVAEVKMGDAESATGQGQQLEPPDDLVTGVARAVWSGPELPDGAAARLVRLGYLRVDRAFARDVYAAADQVEGVREGTVDLAVTEDQLVAA